VIEADAEVLSERQPRRLHGGQGGVRRRGDNVVSPQPRVGLAAPGRTRSARTARPAALEWQEARLPVLGRLWATAWLPSVLLAGCLVALMYLLQTSGVATVGYDIQHLQVERDDWQLRNEQLRLELAKRRSLTWIESEAIGRLGMVRAEPTALAYLKITR
jgi:hypothetical protein